MTQARWPTLVPLGGLVVSAQGTTVLLSANCGPLGGQISGTNYLSPAVAGTPLRQLILTSPSANTVGVVLLPRGNTFTGNPGNVIAYIGPGQTVAIPYGQPFENGILPENFCLDVAAAGTATIYGCGIIS